MRFCFCSEWMEAVLSYHKSLLLTFDLLMFVVFCEPFEVHLHVWETSNGSSSTWTPKGNTAELSDLVSAPKLHCKSKSSYAAFIWLSHGNLPIVWTGAIVFPIELKAVECSSRGHPNVQRTTFIGVEKTKFQKKLQGKSLRVLRNDLTKL